MLDDLCFLGEKRRLHEIDNHPANLHSLACCSKRTKFRRNNDASDISVSATSTEPNAIALPLQAASATAVDMETELNDSTVQEPPPPAPSSEELAAESDEAPTRKSTPLHQIPGPQNFDDTTMHNNSSDLTTSEISPTADEEFDYSSPTPLPQIPGPQYFDDTTMHNNTSDLTTPEISPTADEEFDYSSSNWGESAAANFRSTKDETVDTGLDSSFPLDSTDRSYELEPKGNDDVPAGSHDDELPNEGLMMVRNESFRRHSSRRFHVIPKAGYRRCAGCTVEERPASVWCCECSRCLCDACDERMHDTDALDALRRPLCSHRVEYIIGGGGLPILSPLLEWAILGAALALIRPLWTRAGSMLNVDYFFESVCPIVSYIRRWVFEIDHALYPLVRGQLSAWCDTEDAFLKVFSDLWVRGVLTHTDSFALLLMKIPSSIGALLVYLTLAPLLAIPYAILATMVRMVENTIFPNWIITRMLARLIRLVTVLVWLPFWSAALFCRATTLGLLIDQDFKEHFHRKVKIPPKTGARKRPLPSRGLRDIQIFGAWSRITRVFWYFHRKAHRAIVGTIVTAVFIAVSLRALLLSIPRCGSGLLTQYAEEEMWGMLTPDGDNEPLPKCVSIDIVARKLSRRVGVELPDFASLGDEGRVLARMQQSTENDYLDDTLRMVCKGIYKQFLEIPSEFRWSIGALITMVVFAGLMRRIMFWYDIRRRQRYHRLRQKKKLS